MGVTHVGLLMTCSYILYGSPIAFQDPYHKWRSFTVTSNVSPPPILFQTVSSSSELKHLYLTRPMESFRLQIPPNYKCQVYFYPELQPQLSMSLGSLDKVRTSLAQGWPQ